MKRYADDVVVRCHSERMAYRARSRPKSRALRSATDIPTAATAQLRALCEDRSSPGDGRNKNECDCSSKFNGGAY